MGSTIKVFFCGPATFFEAGPMFGARGKKIPAAGGDMQLQRPRLMAGSV
jgi:hypothetical protein